MTKSADEIAEATWKKMEYEDLAKKKPCFLAGTLISTPNGKCSIENLREGHLVYVFNRYTNEYEERKINTIYKNWTNKYIKVTLTSGETIEATYKHLFWVESHDKWLSAQELKKGMVLHTLNGGKIEITSLQRIKNVELPTFNLEIDLIHNYFVGEIDDLISLIL